MKNKQPVALFKTHLPKKGKRWSPEEDVKLLEMAESGKSYLKAARELGRPYSVIARRLWILRKQNTP